MVCIIGDKKSPHIIKYCKYLELLNEPYIFYSFSRNINNHYIVFWDIILKFIKISLKKSQINVVHIHYIGKYSILGLALSFMNFKIIYTAWGSDVLLEQNHIKVFFLKLCLNKSYAVLGDSDRIRERLKKISKKINYLHYDFGVDPIFYKKMDISDSNLHRYKFHYEGDDVNIFISVRRLEKIYNIKLIIEAFIDLLFKKPNSILIIMGTGSEYNYLNDYSKNYSNRIFFTGEFNQIDLITVLNFNPIIISASSSDAGLSTTIAECMAYGSLCVLSNVADNHLWIDSSYKKLLFSVNKSELLESMFYALDLNSNQKDELKIKQMRRIRENNDGISSTKKIIELYKNA